MGLKDWKKIGKDVWEHKYKNVRIEIHIIGNPEFAISKGLFDARADNFVIYLITGNYIQYHRQTFEKKSEALKVIKNYMRKH